MSARWNGATPLTFEYQWVRCPADGGLADGSNCTSISEADERPATRSSSDDVGQRLRIRVTASNSLGVADGCVERVRRGPVVLHGSTAAGAAQHAASLRSSARLRQARYAVRERRAPGPARRRSRTRTSGCGATPTEAGRAAPAARTISGATIAQYGLTQHRPRTAPSRPGDGAQHVRHGDRDVATRPRRCRPPGRPRRPRPPRRLRPHLPPGAVRLPDGKYSIPVHERLAARCAWSSVEVVFTPQRGPIPRGRPLVAPRPRRSTRAATVVRDALVFARSTPLVTSSPGERAHGPRRLGDGSG